MTRSMLRYVQHRIAKHPNTDVTFEAKCLRCDWAATPSTDDEVVDIECMRHTGLTPGHKDFRRSCTSFALVERVE
ncbi:DUF7848 domain-containing protein [Streptomyces sp. NPDC004752]